MNVSFYFLSEKPAPVFQSSFPLGLLKHANETSLNPAALLTVTVSPA